MTIPSQHGGKRAGAGRPKGTGKRQEPTQAIRVPSHLLPQIHTLIDNPGMYTERLTGDIAFHCFKTAWLQERPP